MPWVIGDTHMSKRHFWTWSLEASPSQKRATSLKTGVSAMLLDPPQKISSGRQGRYQKCHCRSPPVGQRGRNTTSSLSLMAASVKFLLSLSNIFLCSSRTFHSSLRLSFSCSMGQFPWTDAAASSHWELSCCCDSIKVLDTTGVQVIWDRDKLVL